MKNYLFLALLFICGTVFGQHPYNTTIEANLNKNVKYAQMSENNVPKPTGRRYASKGQYKSVTSDVFKEQYLGVELLTSGQYDPIFSDSVNITSVDTVSELFTWSIVGNTITISGAITIDAIADSIATATHFSLPTSLSNYTITSGAGVATSSGDTYLTMVGIISEDEGLPYFSYRPLLNTISTTKDFYFTFTGHIE